MLLDIVADEDPGHDWIGVAFVPDRQRGDKRRGWMGLRDQRIEVIQPGPQQDGIRLLGGQGVQERDFIEARVEYRSAIERAMASATRIYKLPIGGVSCSSAARCRTGDGKGAARCAFARRSTGARRHRCVAGCAARGASGNAWLCSAIATCHVFGRGGDAIDHSPALTWPRRDTRVVSAPADGDGLTTGTTRFVCRRAPRPPR